MKPELSPQEQDLLTQYQRLPVGRWHFLNLLAVEIVPPALFVALWAWTGRALFLLLLVAVLVCLNVLRVLRQRRTRALLASISGKLKAADDA
ncbi:MAG: hypothetical protein ACN6OS_00125 [Comamonas testosteroni]|uniref:hypothetical protein n=1 Tax=Comamonas testosteroni TaxID=285 RepID=UPI003D12D87C